MFDLMSIAEAGTNLNFSRNFQLFHGELVGGGVMMGSAALAFSGAIYMMRKHMDQLMDNAVPILVGGGIIAGSGLFATGIVGGGAAGAPLVAAVPVLQMAEYISDGVAAWLYWTPWVGLGMSWWRRVWH